MSRIRVIADTHGASEWAKIEIACKGYGDMGALGKDDYLIIAGDYDICLAAELLARCEKMCATILIIEGNHDALETLYKIAPEPYLGGMARRLASNVYNLCSGYIFDIAGKSILALGGAKSIDGASRTPGIDYFPDLELPSSVERGRGLAELEKRAGHIDYIISHTTSAGCAATLLGGYPDISPAEEYLMEVYRKATFMCAIFGHFHQDCEAGKGYRCVYKDVLELTDDDSGYRVAYDHGAKPQRIHHFVVDEDVFSAIELFNALVFLHPADATASVIRPWDRLIFSCPTHARKISCYVRRIETGRSFSKVAKRMGIEACGFDRSDNIRAITDARFPQNPFYAMGFELGSVHPFEDEA